jgi:hypothetical protein
MFSPPLTTLAAALRKDFLIRFPSLTKETLAKYPPQSMATFKGHLNQTRTNRKSITQLGPKEQNPLDPFNIDKEDLHPKSENPNIRTHQCCAATLDITGQVYGDQTGRFAIPSSRF